ncbi:MAG: hypothetical protein QXT92_05760 [Nitrososphaerota archaeon]
MGRSEEAEAVADAVVRALVAKVRAMEALDRGLLSDAGVTTLDRVAVILGSLNPRFYRRLLSTEPREEDIARVLEVAKDTGMWSEEAVLLAMVRRLVADTLRSGVARLSDLLNTSDEGGGRRKAVEVG